MLFNNVKTNTKVNTIEVKNTLDKVNEVSYKVLKGFAKVTWFVGKETCKAIGSIVKNTLNSENTYVEEKEWNYSDEIKDHLSTYEVNQLEYILNIRYMKVYELTNLREWELRDKFELSDYDVDFVLDMQKRFK